jgi:hypothetical protein
MSTTQHTIPPAAKYVPDHVRGIKITLVWIAVFLGILTVMAVIDELYVAHIIVAISNALNNANIGG